MIVLRSLIPFHSQQTPVLQRCGRLTLNGSIIALLAFGLLLQWSNIGQAARVIEEISFESGTINGYGTVDPSLGTFDPGNSGTGWQFQQSNVVTAVETPSNPDRPTFSHGDPNDQGALVIHPYAQSPFTAFGQEQGAIWNQSFDTNDPNLPVETIDAGEVFYVYTEYFSDVSTGTQAFKTNIFFGEVGDGNPNLGIGAPAWDSGPGSNSEAGWTWGDNNNPDDANMSGSIYGNQIASQFSNTRYGNPPSSAELTQNHIGIMVYRQMSDAATPAVGTEMELSETLGNFNGGESSNPLGLDPNNIPAWGGNSTVITGNVVDKAVVQLRRQRPDLADDIADDLYTSTFFDDPNASNCTGASSPADCIYNAQLGVRYLRIGTAEITDINLDGVTDSLDEAIVMENLNKFGPTAPAGDFDNDGDVDNFDFLVWQSGFPTLYDDADLQDWQDNYGTIYLGQGTFFDGDIDNDLDVDGDDLALVQAALLPFALSVPEPSAAFLLLIGAMCLTKRNSRY